MGHNLHHLTDTGASEEGGFGLKFRYYFLPSILSWLSALRQYVLLVLVNAPQPRTGKLRRVILSLFLQLISSSRLYILGVIYPWPLAICIVAVMMSVHYRIALTRKIFGTINLQMLLLTSFTISLLPAIVHVARWVACPWDGGWDIYWDLFSWLFCGISLTMLSFLIIVEVWHPLTRFFYNKIGKLVRNLHN